jgi:rhodanese-related sulfurtransferase
MKHSPGFLRLVDAARKHIRETSIEEVKEMIDAGADVEIIDVREDGEWAAGHLPSARHIGKGVIERDIEAQVDRDRPIVLYCGGGYRSALAAESIQKMGYKNVRSMDGGFRAWNEAGLPIAYD